MNKDYIYLDHAAATPMDPLVVEAMLPYFSEKFFNPSSPYAPAIFTKREYQDAKARLARCLGVMADELIMTAGATESVNLAFNAVNGVSLISAIEHDSVINSAKARSEVKLIPPLKNGRIDPNVVKKMLTPDIGFVSVALVNHELGYIQPIEEIAEIVKGVATGCEMSSAALLGGETAEMPGFYPEDEYDLAGFSVGVCDKKDMITGENLQPGDVLIGMASTGVHSNGFSLVRRVFEKEMTAEGLNTYYDELGKTLGETLLAPTRIYVKALKNVKKAGVTVKGCSHITGGGFYENVPRMLPEGAHAVIEKSSYEVPAIFRMLQKEGDIEEHMMYNTFNMGIGLVLAIDPKDVDTVLEAVKAAGETPYVIGHIEAGEKGVTVC